MLPQPAGDDAILQFRHFRGQRGLVADRGRHAPEQPRDLGARLHEAEHVVHQEQHLPAEGIAQVFGVGKRGKPDAKPHPRRLVHLSEYQHRIGEGAVAAHLVPQFVPLADALADPGEHRHPAVQGSDRLHELHDEHRLAHARAAEQAGLAAADEGTQKVDDLDAGFQNALRGQGVG